MKTQYLYFPLCLLLTACNSTPDEPVQEKAQISYDVSSVELRSKTAEYWQLIKHVEPQYPLEAEKKGLSGCVKLLALVNSQGKPQGYKVLSSYPEGVFDVNAVRALNAWRWKAVASNESKQPILGYFKMDFKVRNKATDAEYLENCAKM